MGKIRQIDNQMFWREQKKAQSFGIKYEDGSGGELKQLVVEAISERVKTTWLRELVGLCPSATMAN
jgi:uncharacterized protein (UPF0248 family)